MNTKQVPVEPAMRLNEATTLVRIWLINKAHLIPPEIVAALSILADHATAPEPSTNLTEISSKLVEPSEVERRRWRLQTRRQRK